MKVYSIGTATLDIFFIVDNFNFLKKLKEKNDIEGYFIDIGGGGLNFAYNFQKLGLDSIAVIKLGNDFLGRVIRKRIEEKNIKAHIITTKGNSTLSFILLNKTNGKKYIFTHRGDEIFKVKDIPITHNNAYYIATGRTNINVWKKITANLKENNNFVGVNPSRYFLKNINNLSYFQNIDFLNINFDEASIILGNNNQMTKIDFLRKLKKHLDFIKYILVTDGNRGAWFLTKDKIFHSSIYKKLKVVDTTGAGDSFGSTVFAYLVKNKFKEDENLFKLALKSATFTTAYNLTKIGAQTGILSINELKKMENKKLKIHIYRL
jgi:fructokinase